jgi:hypothetical protein
MEKEQLLISIVASMALKQTQLSNWIGRQQHTERICGRSGHVKNE